MRFSKPVFRSGFQPIRELRPANPPTRTAEGGESRQRHGARALRGRGFLGKMAASGLRQAAAAGSTSVKPIFSRDLNEAKRRVRELYRAWYREVPNTGEKQRCIRGPEAPAQGLTAELRSPARAETTPGLRGKRVIRGRSTSHQDRASERPFVSVFVTKPLGGESRDCE